MIFFFIIILLLLNILIFSISQNIINLLVFIIIYFIISYNYKKLVLIDFLQQEKEQFIFINFLIKIRLFLNFYSRYIELELYNIIKLLIHFRYLLIKGIYIYSTKLKKAYKTLINLNSISSLNRIFNTQEILIQLFK
jgi:hypothetical protein